MANLASKLLKKRKQVRQALSGVVRTAEKVRFSGDQQDTTYEALYGKPPKTKKLGGSSKKKRKK